MKTINDAHRLLQLLELTQTSVRQIIAAWSSPSVEKSNNLASPALFEARRTLLSAAGMFTELVSDPSVRLLEVSSQYAESRCLHIAAELRIADIIAAHPSEKGMPIAEISNKVNIEPRKLGRLLRSLCSIHIFTESAEGCFANNAISQKLVGNEPLVAYITMFALDIYSACDFLPRTLLGENGESYKVTETAFQDTMSAPGKTRWEWFEEKVPAAQLAGPDPNGRPDGGRGGYPGPWGPLLDNTVAGKNGDDLVQRPEHANFCNAMYAGGLVFGEAHLHDYPWAQLGNATLVDVGGGVGGFCIQLSKLYPNLKFIVQDRARAVQQGQNEVWPSESPEALKAGRVQFMPHDFFAPQPVHGADVYWLRYIMHDWSDSYCVTILSRLAAAMGARSRVVICDQVMNTTLGYPQDVPSAPEPLPANYGYAMRYSHQRDVAMMALINGIERTPREFRDICEAAGLRVRKMYASGGGLDGSNGGVRSEVGLVECVLPDSPLLNEV